MREADLYPPLKRHFEQLGYAVYAEMPAPHGGYVDLLALRDQVSIAVELKPWFSRQAVRQAARNSRFVWESYVAVPRGARILPRRRAALQRHGAGLLSVSLADESVATEFSARRSAPPCTLREAFGEHVAGELAGLYAAAQGGVPTVERVSASRTLFEKLQSALEARGGIANTAELLADTLAWNYCRNKSGGLRWILKEHFRSLAPDLWADGKPRATAEFELSAGSLVRSHRPDTWVCLPDPAFLPRPGDLLKVKNGARLARRARVISAGRHAIVETANRELHAGPAVFFPWRCPAGPLPAETLVLRLAANPERTLRVAARPP